MEIMQPVQDILGQLANVLAKPKKPD